jgi:TctA family transporter
VFEAFLQGFVNFFEPTSFAFIMLGIGLGILVGILPVIGGLVGCAILLPVIYGMDPFVALPFLLALATVAGTGDAICSIVLSMPGSGTTAVDLLDGFPMTKKGQGGRAIGAALGASMVGGLFGACLALVMVPLVKPLVMGLWSGDLFFLIVMGLSFMAVLGRGSMIKALIAGGMGLLLSFVGFQHSSGVDRFAFGNSYLLGGIGFIPVIIGVFAGSEILELFVTKQTVVPTELGLSVRQFWRQALEGIKDIFRHFGLFLRSCILGYFVGIIPGVGAGVATWAAYGMAKQTSKNPERFGTGIVEGVIAPESATNAKEGGALLTTLVLGIPGSSVLAVLLAGFMLVGIPPGPKMITEQMELSFTLLWTLALSNVLVGLICLLLGAYIIKLTVVPYVYFVPSVLTLAVVGAYTIPRHFGGVVVFLIFTVVGVFMKRFGYSRPCLVLGIILGSLFEHYFWLGMWSSGPLFFVRTPALIIIAIIISLYVFDPVMSLVRRRLGRGTA